MSEKKKISFLDIEAFPSQSELEVVMLSFGEKCLNEKEKTERLLRQEIRKMTADLKSGV